MAAIALSIGDDMDIIKARRAAREAAESLGMDRYEVTQVETSISELATNLVRHAQGGTIEVDRIDEGGRRGVRIISRDEGPGMADVGLAMGEGYSTGGTMGSGLPGVRRMMDDFEISSAPGRGTLITATKWRK